MVAITQRLLTRKLDERRHSRAMLLWLSGTVLIVLAAMCAGL